MPIGVYDNDSGRPLFSDSSRPSFTIPEQGWGTGWTAGGTLSFDLEMPSFGREVEAVYDRGVEPTLSTGGYMTEEQGERFREALESVDLEQVVQRRMTRIMAEDIDKLFTPVPKSFTHFRGVRKLKL